MQFNLHSATGVSGSVHKRYLQVPLLRGREGTVDNSDSARVAAGHAPAALVALVERGLRAPAAEVVQPDGG